MRFFMLFSVFYLSLFLSVGLLLARRAVPDGSAAVIVPLGCGFGVSLLAVLPALFAVVLEKSSAREEYTPPFDLEGV